MALRLEVLRAWLDYFCRQLAFAARQMRGWAGGGFIEPAKPGAQRVHRYRLIGAWTARLAEMAEAPDGD